MYLLTVSSWSSVYRRALFAVAKGSLATALRLPRPHLLSGVGIHSNGNHRMTADHTRIPEPEE
jgi:hypothetical protein